MKKGENSAELLEKIDLLKEDSKHEIKFDFLHTFQKDGKLIMYNYWFHCVEPNKVVYRRKSDGNSDDFEIFYRFSRCMIIKAQYASINDYMHHAPSFAIKINKLSNNTPYITIAGVYLDGQLQNIEIYLYYIPKFAQRVFKKIKRFCDKNGLFEPQIETLIDDNWSLYFENIKPSEYIIAKAGIQYLTFMVDKLKIDNSKLTEVFFIVKTPVEAEVERVKEILMNGAHKIYSVSVHKEMNIIISTRNVKLTMAALLAAVNWIINSLKELEAMYYRIEVDKEYLDSCIKSDSVFL